MDNIHFKNNGELVEVYLGDRFLFSADSEIEAIKELKSQLTY